MPSFLMDWTPTNAVVLQNTPSRSIKRTFDDFIQQPASPQPFKPYAGQYMPGGWPASPEPDRLNDRTGLTLMSGALEATTTRSHEDRIVAAQLAEPENVTDSKPQNIIFRTIKRFCLGIPSPFPTRRTEQLHRTRVTPQAQRSSRTTSSSPRTAFSNIPSPIQPETPLSSAFSTFLSSIVPSTSHRSNVGKDFVEAHVHHANEKSITQPGLAKTTTPPSSIAKDFDSPYLRCANPKLLRKLGLTQSLTPPESPKHVPTNGAPNELPKRTIDASLRSPPNAVVDETIDASPVESLPPPATPNAETGVYSFFRPAAEIILMSPFPKLVPSLTFRSPFKFGQAPSPESHNVYLKGSTPEHSFRTPFNFAASITSKAVSSPTSGRQITPSAQLLAEIVRDRSPVVEVSTPDPYHAKTPLSPPMSGELSAEQQKRYATRSRAKQLEEAAKQLKGYNIEPLPKEWEMKVEHALRHGHGSYTTHDLIKVVAPNGSKSTSQWLNDETINGYLKLVTDLGNRGQNTSATPKYHAFTSFFMTTLLEKGYEGIKRWSKRAKIDGKKLYEVHDVFIPINRNLHWTVLVVSPKSKTMRYYDSLGGNGRTFVAAALQWLAGELGAAFVQGDWMIDSAAASPLQNNGSDCGVFAITTSKQLMLGRSPMEYGPSEIPTQRRRIVAELVAGKLL